MVEAIREIFEKYIKGGTPNDATNRPDPVRVAAAALLIEMARMDGGVTETERGRIEGMVQTKFGLNANEAGELLRVAEQEAREATDYYQFTSLIKDHFTPIQKERLVEHLWDVAYADGNLHPYEEHLVRKIADLLYVPHKSFIAAKLRARAAHEKS
ncbi:MAG: TerB family tellurite resistance protein [Sulfurifustaceae bacterium]